jgi:anti-sigma B factor antagonist
MVSIQTETEEDFFIINISGEIDASSSIHLDNKIGEVIKSAKNILINCTNLKYISSAGLGVFMSYIQEMDEGDIRMILFGMSPNVKNVFEILGLDQLIKMVETKEEAKRLLNAI